MNGAPSLSSTLLAGMGQRVPQQPQPQGGLNAMAPAKQSTDAALQTLSREEQQIPGLQNAANIGYQQYRQQLMTQLQASLPSAQEITRARAARGLMMQNVLQLLEPKEYSGMDAIAAGLTSVDEPIAYANTGAALSKMARGTRDYRKQFEDRELQKATAAYGAIDKELDENQKLMSDAINRQKFLTGGATPEFVLPDGTPIYKSGTRLVYIGKDGRPVEWLGAEKTVIGGDTLYGRHATMVEMLTKEYLDRGAYDTLEEATQAAKREADRLMAGVRQEQGVQDRPETPAAGTPQVGGTPAPTLQVDEATDIDLNMLNSLPTQTRATVMRVINRYQMNPNEGTRKAMEQELVKALRSQPTPPQLTEAPPSSMPKKSVRLTEGEKGYGGEEGKALFKEREALSASYQANAALSAQLDLLDQLYADPNIPEGKLGPAVQQIRSSLKSLGVEVGDDVGAADLANALAQKLVLGIRTADGTNLLPGAISNFEVQMLQSMGPTLGMTAEGRKALVEYMKDVARSQQRLSEEATRFEGDAGRLTPEWYKRKERVILEEQARRAVKLRSIAAQFKGQK